MQNIALTGYPSLTPPSSKHIFPYWKVRLQKWQGETQVMGIWDFPLLVLWGIQKYWFLLLAKHKSKSLFPSSSDISSFCVKWNRRFKILVFDSLSEIQGVSKNLKNDVPHEWMTGSLHVVYHQMIFAISPLRVRFPSIQTDLENHLISI